MIALSARANMGHGDHPSILAGPSITKVGLAATACTLFALGQSPSVVPGGSQFNARITTRLDTPNAQFGEATRAVTTTSFLKSGGDIVLPRGATLNGHVTAVAAAADKLQPASPAIVFDQAVTPKGQRIAPNAGIECLVGTRRC